MKLIQSLAFCVLGLVTAAASAQQPPIPRSLTNEAGAVCLKVAENGTVDDAFVLVSTGSKRKDRDLLAWARQMQWPARKAAGEERNVWFPMALVSGTANPPQMPKRCAPPLILEQDIRRPAR